MQLHVKVIPFSHSDDENTLYVSYTHIDIARHIYWIIQQFIITFEKER